MERRRLHRTSTNTGPSLQLALGSWVRIRGGWESVRELAHGVQNWERMALAEAKLDECRAQIARIETLLFDYRGHMD
jgi:hypothetical protein